MPDAFIPKKLKTDLDSPARFAAVLSVTEIGLGSLLHSLHVPFSGHALSLNQGFLLARATRATQSRMISAEISAVAALLKSLSPAGKKLTPMLAISAQGAFFCGGVLLLGPGAAGITLGLLLLSLWAFLQPVLIYWLFYGEALAKMADFYLGKINDHLNISPQEILGFAAMLVALKLMLALGVAWLSLRASDGWLARHESTLLRLGLSIERPTPTRPTHAAKLALRDLMNPLFVFSLALTAAFLFLAETPMAQMVWLLLRPIAAGFVLFLGVRLLPLEQLASKLGGGRIAAHARAAIEAIRRPD